MTADDVVEFMVAGANAVQVGTANFVDPFIWSKLLTGLTDYLAALADAELMALPRPDVALSGEAMGIARRFVEYHLDRKLASLAVIE